MPRKMRSDSTWSKLSSPQRQTLEDWLFDENLSYQEAQARVLKQWNLPCSLYSLGAFRRRRAAERQVTELGDALAAAAKIKNTAADLASLRSASMVLLGKRLLEKAMDGGEVKELAALGRLLLESEQREIQRGRLALARERWEFNAAEAALAQLPLLHEMSREDLVRQVERIERIQHRIFGNELPESHLPESHLRAFLRAELDGLPKPDPRMGAKPPEPKPAEATSQETPGISSPS